MFYGLAPHVLPCDGFVQIVDKRSTDAVPLLDGCNGRLSAPMCDAGATSVSAAGTGASALSGAPAAPSSAAVAASTDGAAIPHADRDPVVARAAGHARPTADPPPPSILSSMDNAPLLGASCSTTAVGVSAPRALGLDAWMYSTDSSNCFNAAGYNASTVFAASAAACLANDVVGTPALLDACLAHSRAQVDDIVNVVNIQQVMGLLGVDLPAQTWSAEFPVSHLLGSSSILESVYTHAVPHGVDSEKPLILIVTANSRALAFVFPPSQTAPDMCLCAGVYDDSLGIPNPDKAAAFLCQLPCTSVQAFLCKALAAGNTRDDELAACSLMAVCGADAATLLKTLEANAAAAGSCVPSPHASTASAQPAVTGEGGAVCPRPRTAALTLAHACFAASRQALNAAGPPGPRFPTFAVTNSRGAERLSQTSEPQKHRRLGEH